MAVKFVGHITTLKFDSGSYVPFALYFFFTHSDIEGVSWASYIRKNCIVCS